MLFYLWEHNTLTSLHFYRTTRKSSKIFIQVLQDNSSYFLVKGNIWNLQLLVSVQPTQNTAFIHFKSIGKCWECCLKTRQAIHLRVDNTGQRQMYIAGTYVGGGARGVLYLQKSQSNKNREKKWKKNHKIKKIYQNYDNAVYKWVKSEEFSRG